MRVGSTVVVTGRESHESFQQAFPFIPPVENQSGSQRNFSIPSMQTLNDGTRLTLDCEAFRGHHSPSVCHCGVSCPIRSEDMMHPNGSYALVIQPVDHVFSHHEIDAMYVRILFDKRWNQVLAIECSTPTDHGTNSNRILTIIYRSESTHQTGVWSDGFSFPRGVVSIPDAWRRSAASGESRR